MQLDFLSHLVCSCKKVLLNSLMLCGLPNPQLVVSLLGWTPVIGKKKRSVPLHLLHRRAPPHIEVNLPSSDESSCESDCSDSSLVIPDHVTAWAPSQHKMCKQLDPYCCLYSREIKVLSVIFIV